jgi:isocitrate/isopropylmalate dehydrogenase
MVLSAAMMCHHLGEKDAHGRIRRAVAAVTRKKEALTPDIGGKASTAALTDAIVAEVRASPAAVAP